MIRILRVHGQARGRRDTLVASASAAGYAVLAVAFRGRPDRSERRLFTVLNDTPEWPWLRVPQQFGTPWTLVGTAGVLLLRHHPHGALAAACALPLEKGSEVLTKKLLDRPRPLFATPTELRDDAPVDGPAFPSGHAAIATASTYLLAEVLPRSGVVALAGATVLAGYVRVHQGAHWPSDVAAGVCLGTAVAATARGLVGALARLA